MKKNIYRKIIVSILVLFCMISLVFNNNSEYILKVIFLDVGQGDASLIISPQNKKILIDGGPDNIILRRIDSYLNFYERKIDIVVISHFHDDHISGLIEVLRRYKVYSLIYSSGLRETELFLQLLKEANINDLNIVVVDNINEVKVDDYCNLKLINPLVLTVKENENNSLISKLRCGEETVLFSGDNELVIERKLLNSNIDLQADIFKASHHGSKTSNSKEFLKMIKPKIMVISLGLDNRFGHPSSELLERIISSGIKVYRTDISGNIEFSLDISND